jgi:hypothetical protein
MPKLIEDVTASDLQRVARTYLTPDKLTVGWMVPGKSLAAPVGAAAPRLAADRPGSAPDAGRASPPQLRRLSSGLPAIVQSNPLSKTATVELLLSAPAEAGAHPAELPGLDAVVRSGRPDELAAMISQSLASVNSGPPTPETQSTDPVTRLDQLTKTQMHPRVGKTAQPLAVIVSGNSDPAAVFTLLEQQLGQAAPGKLEKASLPAHPAQPSMIRERIPKPLSQGGVGYVVEGPAPGTHQALAWRMLLYILTHDASGRLGRSAIGDKGIVYHIYSTVRTDGARSWATISTGVDPDKADAMEAELRLHLKRLVSDPPTTAEMDAARAHLLGRDLTAAQSNEELAAKLAREFVESGGLRTHDQLRAMLQSITPGDLAKAAQSFGRGTIIRVDVGANAD